ncbi:MAG TPA: N-acetylmuramoyl-L-alanine amidase [Geopsychrobacteraceae bacterium]|nr:N-acetylmuramoyl-L-alanine amidase [Geopsychrobacteraceae bacterium]
MRLTFLLLLISALMCSSTFAAIELAPKGQEPVRLTDVYFFEGVPYVAVDDALDAVSLRGHWNSIKHIYRIKTNRGWAEITPGSSFLKLQDNYYPSKNKPRFIDGRLRVAEDFLVNQLPMLIDQPVYYRNLDPRPTEKIAGESTLDRLFSFLLRKKQRISGPKLNAVAIDPGHGGLDNGVIGPDGLREKEINLQLARRLSKLLKMKLGVPVYLSRDDDYGLTPQQRIAPAAKEDVDVWLLLHAQASFSETAQGVTLLVRPEEAVSPAQKTEESESLQLAKQLSLALIEAEIPVVGIYPTSQLSLGSGDLPTVQIEAGYLSNPQDLKRLRDSEQQDLLAQALYQGVLAFIQKTEEIH